MNKIIQRDYSIQEYDKNRLIKALTKTFSHTKTNYDMQVLNSIVKNIEKTYPKNKNISISIETMQDNVIIVLEKMGYVKESNSYKRYRNKRNKERDITISKNLQHKVDFTKSYIGSENASTGSTFDANANVSSKNVATLEGEVNKRDNILLHRYFMSQKIEELYGKKLSNEYIRQLENHEIYCHDETNPFRPYCVAISLYPFLFEGLNSIGGQSTAPKSTNGFIGGLINLIFATASQFSGAVAISETLIYMDYFLKKDYGEEYYLNNDTIVEFLSKKNKTIEKKVTDYFEQLVYSINQPAAARNFQSVFFNMSVFDKGYFDSLFSELRFPDGSSATWDSVNYLQKLFLTWFNKERERALLTFPVMTVALLTDGEELVDKEYENYVTKEMSEGNSFFIYTSENADSLASCCRLRNEVSENTFHHSLGMTGVQTGSINVITMNVNRMIQNKQDIREEVKKVQKYQLAYKAMMKSYLESNMLPIYSAGYIDIDRQFLTIGINGISDAAESQGIEISDNKEYAKFVDSVLLPIYEENKNIKKETGAMFNTELVPAESLGVKNARWDKEDGYIVNRDCYNSYFYLVENVEDNVIDRISMQGNDFIKHLDGRFTATTLFSN